MNNAPEPSNIIWENLNYGFINKMMRRSISVVLTGGLLIVSFVCLVLCSSKKNQISKQFPVIDCTLP